jgi:N-acyl-D-aspartate/D-glutamate deacylase
MNSHNLRQYDVVIRNGKIYDGSGSPAYKGDVAIEDQIIVEIGKGALTDVQGKMELDAKEMAVAPGFINMLSWATESLIADGRSQSDIRQGVTLEVMGESTSYGPLTESMKKEWLQQQGDIKYDIPWTTLDEYLEHLVKRGISTNVASFVGSGTIRTNIIGYENRPATQEERDKMCALVRQAMEDGAMGLASALIYVPDCFNNTEELTAMARTAAEYDGLYISHLRSEGDQIEQSIDEFLTVARNARIPAEIYHLKIAGQSNWHKLNDFIKRIENAQAQGLRITADMYPYTAGATGLDAAMPAWVQEGGHRGWIKRLRDPEIRARVRQEITTPTDKWENLYLAAGSPDNILFMGFKNDSLKQFTGKTLSEVATQKGISPEETIMDLVIEDDSRVSTAYFIISEENIRKELVLPWISFGSDAESSAPEGVFLKSSTHPRAYGTFARVLGKYVRDEGLLPLEEAIRRMTSLPAANLKLDRRGMLTPGNFADVVIFDPAKIQDHATYAQPLQYSSGVIYVFVNGTLVLKDGEHTGATPGQVVRGPGWKI